MLYVGSQIMLWVAISVLFGFALGWMVRSRRSATVKKSKRRF
jgi:hypothetical protein